MGYRKDKIIRECNAFQISMSDSLGKIQIKKFFFLAKCNRLVWSGKSTTPLGIKVTPSASRFLEIKGQFFIKTEGDDKEQPFKAKVVEQMQHIK